MSDQPPDHDSPTDGITADRDPMNQGVLAALTQIEDAHHADGWDKPPAVYTLRRAVFDMGRGNAIVLEATPWPVPPHIWAAAPPHAILHGLADLLTRHGAEIAGMDDKDTVYGLAFVCEAWQARSAPGDDDLAKAERFAQEQSLEHWAGREEIRFVVAVTRGGTTAVHERVRGTDEKRSAVMENPGSHAPSGRILPALAAMLDLFEPATPADLAAEGHG